VSPALSADGDRTARCWIAVASGEHVQRGVAGGFMQVCHGKAAPLRRIRSGDRVVYYSPTVTFRGRDTLQAFTARGTVRPVAPYPFDMGAGFVPWRRDVRWDSTHPAPIRPLLDALEFSRGLKSWAAPLRFGLLGISHADMALIASAMGVAVPAYG
jgi:hypothetical protein